MSIKFISDKNIYFFSCDRNDRVNAEGVVSEIMEHIQDNDEIGYAGYLAQKDLKRDLTSFIFGRASSGILPETKIYQQEIIEITKQVTKECLSRISIPSFYVFIFPTAHEQVIKEMGGVNGFVPYKRTLHIYINPEHNPGWQEELSKIVAHEYAHIVSREYFPWRTVLDSLIFEGVAEHFREHVEPGERSPWTQVVTAEEAEKVIKKLEEDDRLLSEDFDDYYSLFWGDEQIGKWTGYAVGYVIIETILAEGGYAVIELLKKSPEDVYDIYKKTQLR